MAGIPAGYEDHFYDDDDDYGCFDFNEKDYTNCIDGESIAKVTDSNKNTKSSYV